MRTIEAPVPRHPGSAVTIAGVEAGGTTEAPWLSVHARLFGRSAKHPRGLVAVHRSIARGPGAWQATHVPTGRVMIDAARSPRLVAYAKAFISGATDPDVWSADPERSGEAGSKLSGRAWSAAGWVGRRVAFSRAFLRSTGQLTGPVPFMRGLVLEVELRGTSSTFCLVRWDGNSKPERVNAANLVREDRLHLEPR